MGLVLTREAGQAVVIGDDIVVTVTKFQGITTGTPQVRLHIEAPKNVAIDRPEVRSLKDAAAKRRAAEMDD